MRREIFRQFRDGENDGFKAILSLSHVCSQWRQELHNMPTLWTVFWAEPWSCYDWNLVKFVLQKIIRQHPIPFPIQLGFRSNPYSLDFVLEGFSCRITSLGYGPLVEKGDNSQILLSNHLLSHHLHKLSSHLQVLQLRVVEVPSTLFDGAFACLESLFLHTCVFPWRVASLITLKELTIYDPKERVGWQQILLVLVHLPLLEILKLSNALFLDDEEFDISVPTSLAHVHLPFNPPALSTFTLFEYEPRSAVYLLHKLRFRPDQLKELEVHIEFQPGTSDYSERRARRSIQRCQNHFERWWGTPTSTTHPTYIRPQWRYIYGETKVLLCVDDPFTPSDEEEEEEDGNE
ncbi:hypothetical protein BDN72DRAFT_906921 [Pluteus cervinus]|uniref:Uncharacterized protein n=1 Tax=Pluteus cervinus TaxID=181527 RepID=A0ACD3A050_9AGAR|nr:hypothetical protein BDN72DRAFT_906921 [Pluteus cervinus]